MNLKQFIGALGIAKELELDWTIFIPEFSIHTPSGEWGCWTKSDGFEFLIATDPEANDPGTFQFPTVIIYDGDKESREEFDGIQGLESAINFVISRIKDGEYHNPAPRLQKNKVSDFFTWNCPEYSVQFKGYKYTEDGEFEGGAIIKINKRIELIQIMDIDLFGHHPVLKGGKKDGMLDPVIVVLDRNIPIEWMQKLNDLLDCLG